MPSLKEYFVNDFMGIRMDRTLSFTFESVDNKIKESIQIQECVRYSGYESTRLFTFYIPDSKITHLWIANLLNKLDDLIKESEGVAAIGGFKGDKQVGVHTTVYSKRVYFYTETLLSKGQVAQIDALCKKLGLFVTLRSTDYLETKMNIDKPLGFISHDSRDKEIIAKKLSSSLSSRLCTVWYDEYSLKIGDSLRESIEKGIKEASKCILILTPNYLNNEGWTKTEFNSIFTRERIFNERIILPIWYQVTKEQIFDYSPSLADTVALKWPDPTGADYNKEVEVLVSKVHTALTTKD